MEKKDIQKIPRIGYQLFQDFEIIVGKCVSSESILLSCKQILPKSFITTPLFSGPNFLICSSIESPKYILMAQIVDNKNLSINFQLLENQGFSLIKLIEELFIERFGWNLLLSSITLPIGLHSQCLITNTPETLHLYKKRNFLTRLQSKFQEIRIYDLPKMGRALLLNGFIQIASQYRDNYTIGLVEAVLDKEYNFELVLIIGGGDLRIAGYILKNYKNVKKIINVEIDEKIVAVSRKFFGFDPIIDPTIQNKSLEIIYEDGADYIKKIANQKGELFDGIIIDCTDVYDEDSIAISLYREEFYRNLRETIKKGCKFAQHDFTGKMRKRAKKAGFLNISEKALETPEYGESTIIGIAQKQ